MHKLRYLSTQVKLIYQEEKRYKKSIGAEVKISEANTRLPPFDANIFQKNLLQKKN